MDHPKFIVSNQKEEYISIQRVKNTKGNAYFGEANLMMSRGHYIDPDKEIL